MMYRIFFKVKFETIVIDHLIGRKTYLGCRVRQTQFVTNDQGRSTGECYVVLESKEDADRAKSFNKKLMGPRK